MVRKDAFQCEGASTLSLVCHDGYSVPCNELMMNIIVSVPYVPHVCNLQQCTPARPLACPGSWQRYQCLGASREFIEDSQ